MSKQAENKLLVIIPAYNEEANIVRTVNDLQEAARICRFDYLVVVDGSTDHTREVCMRNGYPMIDLPVNVGLTYAVKAGMAYACEAGYGYALQFDGDGQHDARCIPALLEVAMSGECDIAIGSRFLHAKPKPSLRAFGGILISALIKVCSGVWLSDPTSGMRVYNRRMIELYARRVNINPEPDTLAYLIRCGVRVKEIPVIMHPRIAGKSLFSLSASLRYMVNMLFSIVLIQWFRRKDDLI